MAASSPTSNRRGARRAAFEAIYAGTLRGVDPKGLLSEDADSYAYEVVDAVAVLGEAIETKIQSCTKNWKISRIGAVEMSILRVAVAEIEKGLVPYPVAINEAINLAKKFAGDQAGSFVNGVLSGLNPETQPATEPETPEPDSEPG